MPDINVPNITLPDNEEINLKQTLQRLLAVIARRRWWVLLPAAVTVFATFIALSLLPNKYSSEALLLVVQQQVPQRYVLPTTTTNIKEALQATTEEVLSRTRLLSIIDEFGLYSKDKGRLSAEALLDKMHRDIAIQPIEGESAQRDVTSFKISFIASSPQLAQEITSRLTSLFIEQNLETREHQATTTTSFLGEQLEATKNKLGKAEEQVRAFKMQHLGELPEQQAANLAVISGLQLQIQIATASLARAEEQHQYLAAIRDSEIAKLANDLARLKSERAKLLDLYTPQYPAVLKIDEKIAQTAQMGEYLLMPRTSGAPSAAGSSTSPVASIPRDAPSLRLPSQRDYGNGSFASNCINTPGLAGTSAPPNRSETCISIPHADDFSLEQLHGQLEANRLEIENLSKAEKRLKAEFAEYQRRLNETPVREQELTGILRNYDQLKQDYADLLAKESQSQMAADLEKRQEGQQFRLVDRPSLPTVPSSPNRIKISLGGAAAGIGLGLALALLMDMTDRSFHSEEELSKSLAFQLVVGVPLIRTAWEERSRTRKRAFEWVAGSALGLAVLVAEFYEFYLYRHG